MEKKPKNKWLSFLADGMLSGLMIGIGCVVSMSCENRYLGAFLFSLGLFCIVQFQYGLYTGKVGYIFDRDKAYLGETFFTFLANAIGASLTAGIVHLTRFAADTPVNGMDVTLIDRAQATMSAKLDDSLLSSFVLAFFCGVLMFSAVEGSAGATRRRTSSAACLSWLCRSWCSSSLDSTTVWQMCSTISWLAARIRCERCAISRRQFWATCAAACAFRC